MANPTVSVQTESAGDTLALALAAIPEKYSLSREFPPEVLNEAESTAADVQLPETDRTDLPFLTIDPPGSTDLDQAMYIEKHEGGFLVYYAIADVPSFVTPGGALDVEARQRGQTIYAPDERIPLHPPVISEGAGSLLPGELRGAFVWELTLDASGTVTRKTVARARMRSTQRLDYETAGRSIDDGTADQTLMLLKEVGLARIELERERGGASLNIPSVEIEEEGDSYRLVRRRPLPVEDWNAQISLMTGMAAADMMLGAKVGILRTMPAPDEKTLKRFRRQATALGHEWPNGLAYGEYLRSLDVTNPRELAIMHAAGSLFRGAGYTAFDGSVPEESVQAAVAAPYAHVTAPLRRLVDRFTLVACEAIAAGSSVPDWVRQALPELPSIMATSDQTAGNVERAALNTVEAAVLSTRVGDVFDATVISAGDEKGQIQLTDPAVSASCDGVLEAGAHVHARLVEADIATATVRFELAGFEQTGARPPSE